VQSIASINVLTAANATNALAAIDGALTTVNSSRATLGAVQNRFSSVVASLQTTAENLTASRSRIQDADFALETANLSRAQILQQAGTAMVAQANQIPQGVLKLLQ
jgi:flagellin